MMKSKSIRTQSTRKLPAVMLGACLTAGLLAAAVTPAHADIYNPYGGFIPYTYNDDNGTPVTQAAFRVETNTVGRGWFSGSGTTTTGDGEPDSRVRAIRFTQLLDNPKICVQVYKNGGIGWTTSQEQCTSTSGSQITLGDTVTQGWNAIQSMIVRLKDCTYNDNLIADFSTSNRYRDWQGTVTGEVCSQRIVLGVHSANLPFPIMGAFDLKIKRNDGNCASCSASGASLPATTSLAPVAGGTLRPIAW
jgi:hypothetical protein